MFRPRWVEHTYAGFPLRVWLTDPVAQDWYDSDWPEPDEVSLLKLHAAHTGHGLTTGRWCLISALIRRSWRACVVASLGQAAGWLP